jgi:hypothetical protein
MFSTDGSGVWGLQGGVQVYKAEYHHRIEGGGNMGKVCDKINWKRQCLRKFQNRLIYICISLKIETLRNTGRKTKSVRGEMKSYATKGPAICELSPCSVRISKYSRMYS